VTETERHPAFRTLVASFLFTDLVGYSKGTAAEQYAAKATLSDILRSNLAALRDVDYRIKDTGDGALIAFVSNPEHALYMALAIAEGFGRAAAKAGFPSNSLRTGVHLGSVKESTDLEARPNFVGDGINAAKRIMDFAAPGQITASRAFFEAVASLDSAYAELFTHVGAPDDKHGRAHDMYAIAPNPSVLERLKLDLKEAAHDAGEFAPKVTAASNAKPGSTTVGVTGSPTKPARGAEVVRKAALPFIAVLALGIALVFAVTKYIEPGVSRGLQTSPTPSDSVASPAPAQGMVARPTPPEAIVDDVRAASASAPKPDVASPVRAPRAAEGAPAADLAQPMNAARDATPTTSPKSKPRTDSSLPAAAATASDRASQRCSLIIAKATLGETLSPEEKRELTSSCR
jgi:hypothetical protein